MKPISFDVDNPNFDHYQLLCKPGKTMTVVIAFFE
jgi:hypothetical protein